MADNQTIDSLFEMRLYALFGQGHHQFGIGRNPGKRKDRCVFFD
jgi:hypothetical protein